MTKRFNLLVSFNGGCGAVDSSPPQLIKTFEISGDPEIPQEVIEIQIISYIKANPDQFMDLWEILANFHNGGEVVNLQNLPEFFQEYLNDDLDCDDGEALLNLMGIMEEVKFADLQNLLINSTITQETDFCYYETTISLQEIPPDNYIQL